MNNSTDKKDISLSLTKKLLTLKNGDRKIQNEAVEAATFILQQFVAEALNRASIEAEFDANKEEDIGVHGFTNDSMNNEGFTIDETHILKIACEMLMDFS